MPASHTALASRLMSPGPQSSPRARGAACTDLIANLKGHNSAAGQVCQYGIHLLCGQRHVELVEAETKDKPHACSDTRTVTQISNCMLPPGSSCGSTHSTHAPETPPVVSAAAPLIMQSARKRESWACVHTGVMARQHVQTSTVRH